VTFFENVEEKKMKLSVYVLVCVIMLTGKLPNSTLFDTPGYQLTELQPWKLMKDIVF